VGYDTPLWNGVPLFIAKLPTIKVDAFKKWCCNPFPERMNQKKVYCKEIPTPLLIFIDNKNNKIFKE